MRDDDYVDYDERSWGSRIKEALTGIVFGLAMFIGAFPLLIWNESNSFNRYTSLQEAESIVVEIDSEVIQAENESKLVYVQGLATTDEILSDDFFGVSGQYLRLVRNVEMYQWTESVNTSSDRKTGGGETVKRSYSYGKAWRKDLVDSKSFKRRAGHENPDSIPYQNTEYNAKKAAFGAFQLEGNIIKLIRQFEGVAPPELGSATAEGEVSRMQLSQGKYYIGDDPQNPQIGDVTISFAAVKPSNVTIMARQSNNTFRPYKTTNGGEIHLLEAGFVDKAEVFTKSHSENKLKTWLFRLGGLILMTLGLNFIFRPLIIVADYVPILGSIVGAVSGFASLLLSFSLTVVTIGVSWLAVRPATGYALLGLAALTFIFMIFKVKSNVSSNKKAKAKAMRKVKRKRSVRAKDMMEE